MDGVRALGHYPSDKDNNALARALRKARAAHLFEPAEEHELDVLRYQKLRMKAEINADEEKWLDDKEALRRPSNEATLRSARIWYKDGIDAYGAKTHRRIYHKDGTHVYIRGSILKTSSSTWVDIWPEDIELDRWETSSSIRGYFEQLERVGEGFAKRVGFPFPLCSHASAALLNLP